jgi:hypothetical protein
LFRNIRIGKRARWAGLGIIALCVVAVLSVPLWNLSTSKTAHADDVQPIVSADVAQELKAQLQSGHLDPDALRNPNGSNESPSADAQYEQIRAYPGTNVAPDAYTNGFNQYSLMSQPGGGGFGWKELGPLSTPNGSLWGNAVPSTISGRATALAVDPSSCSGGSCSTIYLGTANGGIWKTPTGGRNWLPLTEHQSAMAIGSLVLDPSNSSVIYAGTGEPNNAIDNNRGQGILKSTNGGRSWTTLGFNQFVNRAVGDIVIDPTNGNLYVISYQGRSGGSGTTYGSGLQNPYLPPLGFYRSTDGGQTWTLSNPGTLPTDPTGRQGATSLVRASDGTLYLGIHYGGIFKSTDGGLTWASVPNASESIFDRITLAVAASDPAVLYAAYSHDIDGPGGMTFYRSTDGGASWTAQTNTPSACEGQCWYDMPVAVSPTDSNEVYVGGSFNYNGCPATYPYSSNPSCNSVVMKSLDGGATWYELGSDTAGVNVHPDDHAILPTVGGGLYTANDGGIFHSANDGASWESLNNGIGTLQFQGVSVNTNGDVFGGTQDNGTWMLRHSSTNGVHILAGDGGMTAADTSNPNIAFDEYYGSQLERFDASNSSQTWMTGWWADYFIFGWGQFYEPVSLGVKDTTGASASNVVFSGTNRLWRSKLGGGIDANHDGDATNDPGDTTDFVPITPRLGANITVIAVSPVNPNVVAIGLANGQVYFTTNALGNVQLANLCAEPVGLAGFCSSVGMSLTESGADACAKPWLNGLDTSTFCDYVSGVTWTRLDVTGSGRHLPNRGVTGLTFAPGSTNQLYATYSGFSANPASLLPGHVFVTNNPGASVTWSDITGSGTKGLPDLPANDIVVTPKGQLVVAQDIGVFSSKDSGATWQRDDYTLSNAPIYDLALSPDGKTIYAATHGRGIWRANVPGA